MFRKFYKIKNLQPVGASKPIYSYGDVTLLKLI